MKDKWLGFVKFKNGLNINTKIFLIGMPGCGKSTLGKQLANALELKFIDLDQQIETFTESTVSDVFASKGEGIFRDIECAQLSKVIEETPEFLMAAGGGTPCFFDNIETMKSSGLVVFLNTSVNTIAKRLIDSKGLESRPLLDKLDKGSITEELTSKLQQRLPYYAQAHIIVEGADITLQQLKEELDKYF